jgi:hypothetical protein
MIPTTTRTRQKYNLPSCFGELSGDGPVSTRARARDSNCFCSALTLPLCCCCLKTVTQDTAASVTGTPKTGTPKRFTDCYVDRPDGEPTRCTLSLRDAISSTRDATTVTMAWALLISSSLLPIIASARLAFSAAKGTNFSTCTASRSECSVYHSRKWRGKTTYLHDFQTSQRQLTTAERGSIENHGLWRAT